MMPCVWLSVKGKTVVLGNTSVVVQRIGEGGLAEKETYCDDEMFCIMTVFYIIILHDCQNTNCLNW